MVVNRRIEYAREVTRACRINRGRVINRRLNMLGK